MDREIESDAIELANMVSDHDHFGEMAKALTDMMARVKAGEVPATVNADQVCWNVRPPLFLKSF